MSTHSRHRGPYEEEVAELTKYGYPNLGYLSWFMSSRGLEYIPECTVLDFSRTNEIEKIQELGPNIYLHSDRGTCRRMFILEDLSTSWIEHLGSMWNIEPQFFESHTRATDWEHHDDKSNPPMLPSVRNSIDWITLRYFEAVSLGKLYDTDRTELLGSNVYRRIEIRNPRKDTGKTKSIGLVTRLASFWHRMYKGGHFEAVLLLDRSLDHRIKFKYDGDQGKEIFRDYTWEPWAGGYMDFARISEVLASGASILSMSPRLNVLRHEYKHNGHISLRRDFIAHMDSDLYTSPSSHPVEKASTIIQRIVLANWMTTIAVLYRDFHSLPLQSLSFDSENTDHIRPILDDLILSRNWLAKCCFWADRSVMQLGINPTNELFYTAWKKKPFSDAELLACDWTFLIRSLEKWRADTDRLVNNRMVLLRVLDSRQQRADSVRNGAISMLGNFFVLVYTPLAFAAGLFSMGGDFAPGQEHFWQFWAVSLPLIFLTCSTFLTYRYREGIEDELKKLKSWTNGDERARNHADKGNMFDVEGGPEDRDHLGDP